MMEQKIRRRELFWHLINIIIPLIFGAIIYLRSDGGTYFHDLMGWLHVEWVGSMWGEEIAWLRYWGCDFLWAYALFFSVFMICQTQIKAVLIASACAVAIECLQLIRVDWLRCGYFDILDIIVEILAICIGCAIAWFYKFVERKRRKYNEHRKQYE